MSGLTLVRAAGLDPVVGPDGNVKVLLQVSIVVADEEIGRAVGVLVPAFVSRGDVLSRIVFGLNRQLLGAKER